MKNMAHKEAIEFITEHTVHRFSIHKTLTPDVQDFAELYKIKLLNSSPYYAQDNGQAKPGNKTLIEVIKKKFEDNPRRWHEILSEALWAYHISKHGTTKVTAFEVMYGKKLCYPSR